MATTRRQSEIERLQQPRPYVDTRMTEYLETHPVQYRQELPAYYDPQPYPPARYVDSGPSRNQVWIAAIVGGVILVIILFFLFIYMTQPPAPIVHHSNPSCLFWCD
jgi:hypothetical protein